MTKQNFQTQENIDTIASFCPNCIIEGKELFAKINVFEIFKMIGAETDVKVI